MAGMNDFEYVQSGMTDTINSLRAAKDKATTNLDEIKANLKENLLATGMSGTTADALLATFENEVVKPSEDYLATAEHFINQNTNVQTTLDETSAKNVNIASQ